MSKYTDEHNPDLILQSICTDMLAQAARGELDLNALARKELANRGVDWHGHWVGFDKAAQFATCWSSCSGSACIGGTMSSLVYITCEPYAATCLQCADCEDDGADSNSFYDGAAAIATHAADWPQHQHITWLRREVA